MGTSAEVQLLQADDDVPIRYRRWQPDGVPQILLGHSMGSIIALAAAERDGYDLAGLVLSDPVGVGPHLAGTVAASDAVAGLPDGLPVLLLSGRRDPVGRADGSQVTARADMFRTRGLPVEQRLYPDARHEVFNETNRDEVTADLLTWLDHRLG
ncbi:alpha/beta hydrolase [Geodermatophilus sp. SYSU D00691]